MTLLKKFWVKWLRWYWKVGQRSSSNLLKQTLLPSLSQCLGISSERKDEELGCNNAQPKKWTKDSSALQHGYSCRVYGYLCFYHLHSVPGDRSLCWCCCCWALSHGPRHSSVRHRYPNLAALQTSCKDLWRCFCFFSWNLAPKAGWKCMLEKEITKWILNNHSFYWRKRSSAE